ncbi:hypothetical protein MPSI1_001514 [Malassezia psittaci]|uniref:CRAL-TRIO domain-containing protein n=1 Tax=Malassezia psittaci TaxID=1821823 RepID=A0AAF0F9M4_9BASI|nr:hypothetical protein MPSI1_001514 [Malassezia psittaci]
MFGYFKHTKPAEEDASGGHNAGTTDSKTSKAGRPGNLTPTQQHQLQKFRADLQQKGVYTPDRHDDACLCRFLRARKWDLAAAEEMLMEAEKWRKENKVDELYATFTFPEKKAVSELYPKFYHKTDIDGRPVYIEQMGNLNIKKLFEITTPERLIQQLIVEYERFQRERLPVCSEVRHELIETSCTILDLKNVGVAQFWKVSSYVQQASRIGQYYYPETMGRFYIINAPYIFTTVWSVVKGWLDPVTTEKIQILGSNPVGEMSKQIPLENLPALIGGKCQCPGGCQMSDAGPWKTPEGQEIIAKVKQQKEIAKEKYQSKQDPSPEAPNTAVAAAPQRQASTASNRSRISVNHPSAATPTSSARVSFDAQIPSQSTAATSEMLRTTSRNSSESLAPPLTNTNALASPVETSQEFPSRNPANGEITRPST